MRKGDILLIHYNLDPIAFIIRKITKSKWNHCAWFIDKHTLIESKSGGIKITKFQKYRNKFLYKIKLVRFKRINQNKLKQSVNNAINLLSKRNYLKFLKSLISIKFKLNKHLSVHTCSSLISSELFKIGVNINLNKSVCWITPEDINKCKLFKDIDIN